MSNITCNNCGFDENPQGTEYCEACGCELTPTDSTPLENTYSPPEVTMMPPMDSPMNPSVDQTVIPSPQPVQEPEPIPSPSYSSPSIMGNAKLVAKLSNAPKPEFEISANEPVIIGRFDNESGPVDIDLIGFPDDDTISRNHAEIYFEGNQWKIKPLSTTNGTFIKKVGESRFGGKLTTPEIINSGDEIAFAKLRFIFQTY